MLSINTFFPWLAHTTLSRALLYAYAGRTQGAVEPREVRRVYKNSFLSGTACAALAGQQIDECLEDDPNALE